MAKNYHHPEAHQVSGRVLGLADVIDRLSVLSLKTARPIDWHAHTETEIICCLKGCLEYEFENHAKISLHSGCYLTVPAGWRHRLTGGMDGPCRRLSFYLKTPRARLHGLVPFTLAESRLLLSDILKKRLTPKAFLASGELPRIADLTGIAKLSLRERVELRILTVNTILRFGSIAAPTRIEPKTKIMDEAIRWLEAHYAEKITIDQLTTFMGYGKSRFFTLFKNRTGLSPVEWLNHYRIDKATTLLTESDKPIMNICREVGFACPAFFAKMFHRYKGMTPLRYRQKA